MSARALSRTMPAVRRELLAEVEAKPATAERVEAAVREALPCDWPKPHGPGHATCAGGGHHRDCPAYRVPAVLFALRRLHLGSGAGEVRARRALAELWTMYKTAASHEEATVKAGAIVGAALAQPPSPSAAALEALLGELEDEADAAEDAVRDLEAIGAHGQADKARIQRETAKSFARRLRKAVGWEEE